MAASSTGGDDVAHGDRLGGNSGGVDGAESEAGSGDTDARMAEAADFQRLAQDEPDDAALGAAVRCHTRTTPY